MSEENKDVVITAQEDAKSDGWNGITYTNPTVEEQEASSEVENGIKDAEEKVELTAETPVEEVKEADQSNIFPFESEDDYAHQTNFVGTGNVAYEDTDKENANESQPAESMSEVDIENKEIDAEEAQKAAEEPVATENTEVTEQMPKFFAERIKEFEMPVAEEKVENAPAVPEVSIEPVVTPEFAPITDFQIPTADTEVNSTEKEDVTTTPEALDLPTVDIQPLETPDNSEEERKMNI